MAIWRGLIGWRVEVLCVREGVSHYIDLSLFIYYAIVPCGRGAPERVSEYLHSRRYSPFAIKYSYSSVPRQGGDRSDRYGRGPTRLTSGM